MPTKNDWAAKITFADIFFSLKNLKQTESEVNGFNKLIQLSKNLGEKLYFPFEFEL